MRMLREDPEVPDADVGEELGDEPDLVREFVTVDDPN